MLKNRVAFLLIQFATNTNRFTSIESSEI